MAKNILGNMTGGMEIWLNYKSKHMTKNLSGNMTGGNGNMTKL